MSNWRVGILVAATGLWLVGCAPGSTGASSAYGSPSNSGVTPTANSVPWISGAPGSTVVAGSAYRFAPIARDANGDALAFSIQNKPAWATFSTSTGVLTGTPSLSDTGTYSLIQITVSDGKASAKLTAFTVTVIAPPAAIEPPPVIPPPATGMATLSWTAPTQNTDGSPLMDLAGYRVYHGMNPGALDEMTQVPGAGATTFTFNQLGSGTHYFAVAAYTASGMESALSAVGAKTIL